MKLYLPIESKGYSVKRGKEVEETELEGGSSRFRKDIIGAAFKVNVTWSLDPTGYNYLNAFFRTATERGSLPFQVDLVLDSSEYLECSAHFKGGIELTGQSGLTYFVSAVLEVVAPVNLTETDDDEEIIEAYEELHAPP